MYINGETIIMVASVISALLVIVGIIKCVLRWFDKQNKQSIDIENLKETHDSDIEEMKNELCVVTYGLLSALDGLKQLGCNGEVTKAHDKLTKHINQQAHKQL